MLSMEDHGVGVYPGISLAALSPSVDGVRAMLARQVEMVRSDSRFDALQYSLTPLRKDVLASPYFAALVAAHNTRLYTALGLQSLRTLAG